MKFKHSKEAEKKLLEIKTEIEKIEKSISTKEIEARSEEIEAEKRGHLISLIKTEVEKKENLFGEVTQIEKQFEELRTQEQNQFGFLSSLSTDQVAARRLNKNLNDLTVKDTREYELAFARYVRSGGKNGGNDTEIRALTNTITDNNAGVAIPTTLVNNIEDRIKTGGRIVSLCTTGSIKGMVEYPIAESYSDPDWHTEAETEAETLAKKQKGITLTTVNIDPQFLGEFLVTTKKFEADTIDSFWAWLNAELPDALMRVLDKTIITGLQDGSQGIRGIVTNTSTKFVENLSNHVLNFNTANQAAALLGEGLENENETVIVMNRATFFNSVMSLVGTDGHPIFNQIMSNNLSKPAFYMGGYKVVFSNSLKPYSIANPGDVYMIMGDFSAMSLNFPIGMSPQFIRDDITLMTKNLVRYLSEIYVGGNITKLERFVKITK